MLKKELKKELLEKLSLQSQQIGFDKKVVGQTMWKPIHNGRGAIHLSFIDHSDDFDITVKLLYPN